MMKKQSKTQEEFNKCKEKIAAYLTEAKES